ncbi:MAG: hypothetical protein ACTSU9_08445, partial [Promethearchaeota archaeon]
AGAGAGARAGAGAGAGAGAPPIPVEAGGQGNDPVQPLVDPAGPVPAKPEGSPGFTAERHVQPGKPGPLLPSPPRVTGGAGKPPKGNRPPGKESIESYLKRHFAVLTPKVRRHLRKLKPFKLSEEEMGMILEELAYRLEFEQIEIIDQYVKLQGKDKINLKHLMMIRNLEYPDNMKEWILLQVRDMADRDVDDFLKGLVNSQPASEKKR